MAQVFYIEVPAVVNQLVSADALPPVNTWFDLKTMEGVTLKVFLVSKNAGGSIPIFYGSLNAPPKATTVVTSPRGPAPRRAAAEVRVRLDKLGG